MWRIVIFLLFFTASAFGQAASGNENFDQERYAAAIDAYEKIPADLRDAGIYNRLGISYHLSNQLKPAESAYRFALRFDADNANALNNLAALYYSQRKFSDADRQVRRAMEKSPDNSLMRLNLRAARYARENGRSARETANSLAKQNPLLIEKREGDALQMQLLMPQNILEQATLHEKRGDSFFARRLYEDAIIEYRKAIALDKYNAATLNRLGLVYHQSQKLKDAEKYYREALKQNPYFIEVLNNIGTVEYARQRYGRALDQYQKALKIRPESPTTLLNMAACLFDMERYEEAMFVVGRAIEIDPKILDRAGGTGFGTLIQTSRRSDPVVSFYYAKIYAGQGDKERAISYLHRALDEGFEEFEKIKQEPAFAVLATEEGYVRLMDRIASLSTSNAR